MAQLGRGQYLVQATDELYANIYWGKLLPETPEHGGLLSAFLEWKPWITYLNLTFHHLIHHISHCLMTKKELSVIKNSFRNR